MQPLNIYDSYILGERPIEQASCMRWASYDLSNINGHGIREISDTIQSLLKIEQNKWGSSLVRRAYYATTAITFGLAIGILVELGLTWASLVSIKFATSPLAYGSLSVLAAVASLFRATYQTDKLEIKTKVYLECIRRYSNERVSFQDWYFRRSLETQGLLNLSNRCQELLTSTAEEQQIERIRDSLRQTEIAIEEVKGKLVIIQGLPALSCHILLN